ncbi:tRNA (N6-isopentenyl adenosine(37)-C2)-methylthiotransferase MiaB [Rickettsiales bacterium LUAb2]
MSKKYFIKTWGCQMNVYDSTRIGEVLLSQGYEKADELSEADLVILNTCHIREKATEKVFSEIGRIKLLKDRRRLIGKDIIIGVSGCVAQAEGEEIIRRAPYVDLVFGPQTWHRLPGMLEAIEAKQKVCDTDFPVEEKFDNLPSFFDLSKINNGSTFLAIQEGCDKFCTYCVVPFTRGAEYSRPLWQILNEATQYVQNGAKEITLLGQNVSSYHGEDAKGNEKSLGFLINELSKLNGLERIRYVTSHPTEINDELIDAHQNNPKLMPFLHLPIQAGSDRILKLMNRKHTVKDYLTVIDKLRKANSNMAFSSDFIVGFPGETENDFRETLAVINEVKFIQSFSFIYSKRPGTPAATYEDDVTKATKEAQLYELQALLNSIQEGFNQQSVGKTYKVLLDRVGKLKNQLVGKSPYMQAVQVSNVDQSLLGQIVDLHIISSHVNSLKATLVEKAKLQLAVNG